MVLPKIERCTCTNFIVQTSVLTTQVESPDSKNQSLAMEEEDRMEREKVTSREELQVGAPAPAPAPATAPAPAHSISAPAPI